MKVKPKKQTKPDFTEPEYEALMNMLDLNRAEIGKRCDVSAHAVSWWRSQRKIPRRHLKVLLGLLIEKMREGGSGPLENNIMKIFIKKGLITEEHLKQMRDGVTPDFMSSSPKLASPNKSEALLGSNAIANSVSATAPPTKALDDYEVDELVDALQTKGWIVRLSRKKSK